MTKALSLFAALAAFVMLTGCDERPTHIKRVEPAPPATLVPEAGEHHFSVVETPHSFPFDCYPVDLARRITASGALATTAVARLGQGVSGDALKVAELVLDGLPHTGEQVKTGPGSKLDLEIDFGSTFTVSLVRLQFPAIRFAPGEVKLYAEDSSLLASTTEVPLLLELRFPPTRLRRARIEFVAANDRKGLRITDINVFPSSHGPVPTATQGFSVTHLPEVVQTITGDKGKKGQRRLKTLTDYKRGTGEQGNVSDVQPRVITLDVGRDFAVQQLRFVVEGTWEHGARVEVRDSTTETWDTVVDATTPFASSTLSLPGRRLRYVRITNKLQPGKGTGTGRLIDVAVIPVVIENAPPPKPILELPPNSNAVAAAAVFDAQGRLRRTLIRARRLQATAMPVYFDGRDDLGRPLASGTYKLRAAVSEIRTRTVGAIGTQPPHPPDNHRPFPKSSGTGNPSAVVSDRDGNFYIGSRFEESQVDLRRVAADGREKWSTNMGRVSALAVDDSTNTLYVAQNTDNKDILSRVTADTGEKAAFNSGVERVVVNADSVYGLMGLAVDSGTSGLFVSNRKHGRIEIWDGNTGQVLVGNALTVNEPRAILVEPRASKLWVAAKDGVHRYSFARDPRYRIAPHPELTLRDFQDPFGLAIDAWSVPTKRLLVSDRGSCQVREFSLDGGRAIPGGAFEKFGGCRTPGPLEDRRFFWRTQPHREDWPHLALAPNGTLAVADRGNRRVQAFSAAGTLAWTTFSEYVPSVEVDVVSPTQHRLLTGAFQYSIDTSAIERHPTRGFLRWQRTHNWEPDDGTYFRGSHFSPSMRRTLPTPAGRSEFLYTLTDKVISVFRLQKDRPKRVAAIGWWWKGPSGTDRYEKATWSWHDRDGDESIDFEAVASDSDEVDFQTAGQGVVVRGRPWVDHEGGIAVGFASKGEFKGTKVARVPIARWEKQAGGEPIPVYDWKQRKALIDDDTLRIGATRLGSANPVVFFGVTGNDRIWLNMKAERSHDGVFHSSGGGFLSVNRSTKASSAWFALDERTTAMAVDAAPSKFWYEAASGGPGYWIYVRDADGLPLFRIDSGTVPEIREGWIDNTAGLGVVGTGSGRYVYAEAVFAGAVMVHHVTGLDTTHYLEQRIVLKR